ncbi:MAG: YhbY family RNA-binding protein, partial [Faecalicoccus sp.]|nr:YhbY family RNA-binding protein [Faecalicoccus sp.]
MISSANKKYLRKLSMSYRPLFQIGKEGISYNMIQSMNDSLE